MTTLPTIKEWTAKLRDPTIKQTANVLKDSDGAMCCLGVLSVMAGIKHKVCGVSDRYTFDFEVAGGGSCDSIPPRSFLNSIDKRLTELVVSPVDGVKRSSHLEHGVPLYTHLMDMNDNGKSFSDIADYIDCVLEVSKDD